MRGWIAQGRRAAVSVVSVACVFCAATSAGADGTVHGYVLVKPNDPSKIGKIAAQHGSTVEDVAPGSMYFRLRTPPGRSEKSFANELGLDPRVALSTRDTFLYEATPGAGGTPDSQYHFAFDTGPNAGAYLNQYAYQQVNLGASHALSTGAGVVVAVIDTGVDFTHPDLAGRLLPGYDFTSPGSAPTDRADGIYNGGVGHGTMVAGLILKIAPNATILPIRVLNGDGIGTGLAVVKAVEYAVASGARVINFSLGSKVKPRHLNDALDLAEAAGVAIVTSAGNGGELRKHFPAGGRGNLVTASLEETNVKASYSNWGSQIRVCAPGTGIRSTFPGGYANGSGTSFAAPFVSGQAALILSLYPGKGALGVWERIRGTAVSVDPFNPLYLGELGKGIIDIETSLTATP
jgi:subtilisin family serine protease